MSESFIQLPPDSTGKKSRTLLRTINGQQVHESVVSLDGVSVPTYSAVVAGSAVAANKHHLVIFNGSGSGKIIEILRVMISAETTATVTGYNMGYRLIRTTSAGSGGVAVTVAKMDMQDPDLPTQITVWTNPTTAPSLGAVVAVGSVNPEETGGTSWMPLFECLPHMKPLTLREGEGVTVQQYGTAGVGLFNVYVIFRVR